MAVQSALSQFLSIEVSGSKLFDSPFSQISSFFLVVFSRREIHRHESGAAISSSQEGKSPYFSSSTFIWALILT